MSKTNLIIIFLLTLNVFLIAYIYYFDFKQPLAECLNDPLVYGYKELQNQNNDELFCSCRLDSKNPSPILNFNENGRRFGD